MFPARARRRAGSRNRSSRSPLLLVDRGAFARGDQFEHELPAIAVIYDDAAQGFQPEDSIYFTALTGEAMAWFHACGLAAPGWFWPNGSQQYAPLGMDAVV